MSKRKFTALILDMYTANVVLAMYFKVVKFT